MTGHDETSQSRPTPPPLPWLAWQPGERVTVRYRLPDGDHEAVGTLLRTEPHEIEIRARRGDVTIPASALIVGRRVV